MQLVNLKDPSDKVSFSEAVTKGLGKGQGLYFPESFPVLKDIENLLEMDFVPRSIKVLNALVGEELGEEIVESLVQQAFAFGAPLRPVADNLYCLELFHGPTLAFKDFGGRFMAQCLSHIVKDAPVTILTATSGDTGAAVAHAFHGMRNIRVVILYPKGKISVLQEKMFATLGDNIETIAVEGDFDDCQQLVKAAFDDSDVRQRHHLNSANSINISRLLAQVCYYFEAIAQLPKEQREHAVISVPSGNFGNLTAGLIAKAMGLPVKRFIASTNQNDTVPRYLSSGEWAPEPTKSSLSNAMDVSQPNNWPRIEAMLEKSMVARELISADCVDEEYTQIAMKDLLKQGCVTEPHAAVAYKSLKRSLEDGEVGIFLGTAHPAKFKDAVENILGQPLALPAELAACAGKDILSAELSHSFKKLVAYLDDKK